MIQFKKLKQSLLGLSAVALLWGCGAQSQSPSPSESTDQSQADQTQSTDPAEAEYIEVPALPDGTAITDQYLEPIYYDNEEGPRIGVITLGVIRQDGQYFKDSNNNQELDPYEDWRLSPEERTEDLIGRLTNEQKASFLLNHLMASPVAKTKEEAYTEDGEVIFDQVFADTEPSLFGEFQADLISQGLRASVLRTQPDPEVTALFNNVMGQLAEYDSLSKDEVALPYTILSNPTNHTKDAHTLTSDTASTTFATYPSSLGLAAIYMGEENSTIIKDFAENSRREWDAQGIDAMYGPQVDLATDPRWPRNNGTFGENPEVVAQITKDLVEGYQAGDQGVKDGGVAVTIKHFPGDGASENGFESHSRSGQWRLYPTENSLEEFHLPPFQAAIDANVAAIMTGYSRPALDERSAPQTVNGTLIEDEELANAYNHTITTTLLRDIMGFKGYVNSDSGVIPPYEPLTEEEAANPYTGIKNFGVEGQTPEEAMEMMIKAGTDVMGGQFLPEMILNALDQALISQEDLDQAVSRRLLPTFAMNRFENPYRDPQTAAEVSAETTQDPGIYQAHQDAVVLMKNTDQALPLAEEEQTIYIEYFGGELPDPEDPDAVTFEDKTERIQEEFEKRGFTITDDYTEADLAYFMVEPKVMKYGDQHLQQLSLMEGGYIAQRNVPYDQEPTGEWLDFTNVHGLYRLQEMSQFIQANGGKVITAISNHSPWILSALEPYTDALVGLYGSWLDAQVDVLVGKAQPKGKLPMTMVSSEEAIALDIVYLDDGLAYEVCLTPNDVPGYLKDNYLSDEQKASIPSGSYIYEDADGNQYVAGHGLTYE